MRRKVRTFASKTAWFMSGQRGKSRRSARHRIVIIASGLTASLVTALPYVVKLFT